MSANIEFTEADRKNCPFYYKIGACRHGDSCNREHHKPLFSTTVLIKQMFYNPMIPIVNAGENVEKSIDAYTYQLAVDDFYEEIIDELSKYGQLEDVQVLENLNDHMIGCVYVKYADEDQAEKCLQTMHNRYFCGRKLHAEYSPVTDFREARCRIYDEGGSCNRGVYCNFMHVCAPSKALLQHIRKTFHFETCSRGTGSLANLTQGSSRGDRDTRSNDRTRDRDYRRDKSPSRDRGSRRGMERDREHASRTRSRSRSRDREDARYGRTNASARR